MPPPRMRWHAICIGVIIGFPVAAIAVFVIAAIAFAGFPVAYGAIAALVALLAVSGWLMVRQNNSRRALITALSARTCDDMPPLLEAEMRRTRSQPDVLLTRTTVRMLRRAGHVRTIRICRPADAAAIAPIGVDFEARLLHEGDPSFQALEACLDAPGAGTSPPDSVRLDSRGARGAAASSSVPPEDRLLARSLRRNLVLNGGWVLLLLVCTQIGRAVPAAIGLGRVTFELAAWCAMLFAAFLLPWSAWLRAGEEWLAVPGGLLVRKSARREWKLHLYTPGESLLCLMREETGAWNAIIADTVQCNDARMTGAEAHFLLRAWTSPIPPPPLERLSDLH